MKNKMILNRNKSGFTLAETLITLGIIGVVAAITIPTIISFVPNKNKILLRKAYLTIEQTIPKMINDEVNYPANQTVIIGGHLYPRGFNYTTATTNGTANKFCYFFTDNLNTLGPITCPVSSSWTTAQQMAVTSDGMTWFYLGAVSGEAAAFPVDTSKYYTSIIVDVNGSNNPPNCFDDSGWNSYSPLTPTYTGGCSKPDTFIFGLRFDGRIQIGSAPGQDPYMESVLLAPTKNQQ